MSEVMIFGGTTEGRLLAEYCVERGIQTVVSVVSEYGEQVLPESPFLSVSRQAMSREEMADMIRGLHPRLVFDATHPYAAVVTENVLAACRDTGVEYIRISREESVGTDRDLSGNVVWVDSTEGAAAFLEGTQGNVLVTTGSRELSVYRSLSDYENRVYARVLPDSRALSTCEAAGLNGKHIIGIQGPFSKEMNVAMLRHINARYLVTKEAGTAGGFAEKIQAACASGVVSIVIGRPKKPEGISLEAGKALLERAATRQAAPVRLNLVGIGMGGPGQLTLEAAEALRKSDTVFGAPRMLKSIGKMLGDARQVPLYLSRDVRGWLGHHQDCKIVSVVYSGDTGFYSGAKTLLDDLRQMEPGHDFDVTVYPGISTVSYLCAKLHISWEDACLASAHGRTQDVAELVGSHRKVFLLLGGENSVKNLCCHLVESGYPDTWVSVGERLSYPDERIVTGTAEELREKQFDQLAAVILRGTSERREVTDDER